MNVQCIEKHFFYKVKKMLFFGVDFLEDYSTVNFYYFLFFGK